MSKENENDWIFAFLLGAFQVGLRITLAVLAWRVIAVPAGLPELGVLQVWALYLLANVVFLSPLLVRASVHADHLAHAWTDATTDGVKRYPQREAHELVGRVLRNKRMEGSAVDIVLLVLAIAVLGVWLAVTS